MSLSTELLLKGKAPFKRNLNLSESGHGYLCAAVFLPHFQMIAYCNEKIADCYLRTQDGKTNLWLGHAAFNISAAEALQIREKFEPLGLRTENADPAVLNARAALAGVSP
jgi:hypothetical protein